MLLEVLVKIGLASFRNIIKFAEFMPEISLDLLLLFNWLLALWATQTNGNLIAGFAIGGRGLS